MNDSSFFRFERIADWEERRLDASSLDELGTLGFTKLSGVPFASLSMSNEAFFWTPDGVHLFSACGRHQRVASSFAAFLRWLVEDPVRALSSASVARFYRGEHQYYPVQFAPSRTSR